MLRLLSYLVWVIVPFLGYRPPRTWDARNRDNITTIMTSVDGWVMPVTSDVVRAIGEN